MDLLENLCVSGPTQFKPVLFRGPLLFTYSYIVTCFFCLHWFFILCVFFLCLYFIQIFLVFYLNNLSFLGYCSLFFLAALQIIQNLKLPDQVSNLHPLQWEHGDFTIGSPGKSLYLWIFLCHINNLEQSRELLTNVKYLIQWNTEINWNTSTGNQFKSPLLTFTLRD